MSGPTDPNSPYLPIEAYGAIGNLRTVALVGLNGAIDWCCLPEVDSPAVFAALLDHARGGSFRIAPSTTIASSQRYLPLSNVLETTFDTPGGRLVVTDFMPLRGDIAAGGEHEAAPEIHRILRAVGGDVDVEVTFRPRFNFARGETTIQPAAGGIVAVAGDQQMAVGGFDERAAPTAEPGGHAVHVSFRLAAGHRRAFVVRWGDTSVPAILPRSERALHETLAAWHAWTRLEKMDPARSWAGYWNEHVIRSELALKLLTFAPTGAIAAAATTSLPEVIGGVRNWDYRYSWIRDAGLAAQAFNAMGHGAEAAAYVHWAERVSRRWGEAGDARLHIMYDVRGEHCLPEEELTHLDGYRGSRPVRIGNLAAEQLQLDVYGDLLTAAYEYARMGRDFDDGIWRFLSQVADQAMEVWRKPDDGIWEFRQGPWHFVYSKVMVWAALQRARAMAARGKLRGNTSRWAAVQKAVRQEVLEKGYDPDLNAFTIAYEMKDLDAANLLIPLHEFLPFEDPRVQGTIDRTLERLTANDFVYRYRIDDGLPGEEGAFVLCTFWLAGALALSGRLDEAYRIFDGMASRVNHVGLLAEQIDPYSGQFLGNFPQAFSHIGLINGALYLAHMEGRETPVPEPLGTIEHRQKTLEDLALLPDVAEIKGVD